ncbi:Cytochrome c553 OS=Castellaniella defragrans OX=75697 GN=HNR28_000239 PE=4 SV=1 [Castellaniella defragrans]
MKRALSSMFVAGSLVLAGAIPGLALAQDAAKAPDVKAGEQLFVKGDASRGVLACVTCHGAAGNSTIPANPNLAAMPHEYLVKQLQDFQAKGKNPPARTGTGGTPTIMSSIVANLTPQDMENVALYLSHQKLDWDKAGTATHPSTVDLGQHIWRAGIADRNVPACAACHSANGAGLPAEFPRLAGQHPEYILEQLKLFRSDDRKNSIMHDIASRMTDPDLAAVADYAAGLR